MDILKNFVDFMREQGVIGLAIGFVLGGSVKEVVTALVEDIINPILGIVLGVGKGLTSATIQMGPATIRYGHFLSIVLDFVVIALVVYYVVKGLNLEKLDKKKS